VSPCFGCALRGGANPFSAPWRLDTPFDKFKMYCRLDELKEWNPKLAKLILTYKECFDDEWWYYLSKTGVYVRRVPLWMTSKRMPSEKSKLIDRNQTRLSL